MRSLRVFVLEEFKNNAREAGCATSSQATIARRAKAFPFHATRLVPLYREIGKLPMSGFYMQHCMFEAHGQMTEGQSLYLYLAADFPVYLWDFHAGSYKDHPWAKEQEQRLLVEYGQDIHRALTGVL